MPRVHSFIVMAASAGFYTPSGPNWQRTQTSGAKAEQKLNTEAWRTLVLV